MFKKIKEIIATLKYKSPVHENIDISRNFTIKLYKMQQAELDSVLEGKEMEMFELNRLA